MDQQYVVAYRIWSKTDDQINVRFMWDTQIVKWFNNLFEKFDVYDNEFKATPYFDDNDFEGLIQFLDEDFYHCSGRLQGNIQVTIIDMSGEEVLCI